MYIVGGYLKQYYLHVGVIQNMFERVYFIWGNILFQRVHLEHKNKGSNINLVENNRFKG